MCGRIDQDFSYLAIGTGLGSFGQISMIKREDETPFDWENIPNRNDTRPTQMIPTIVDRAGSPALDFVKWGWWYYKNSDRSNKKVKVMFPNSRNDTILENLGNPFKKYNQALSNNRVLIPAQAFYEWPVIDGKKVKYRITLDEPIFMFGGSIAYCEELDKTKHAVVNIITRFPGDQIAKIHDREPLIIPKDRQEEWLLGQKFASPQFLNSFFEAKSPEFKIQAV